MLGDGSSAMAGGRWSFAVRAVVVAWVAVVGAGASAQEGTAGGLATATMRVGEATFECVANGVDVGDAHAARVALLTSGRHDCFMKPESCPLPEPRERPDAEKLAEMGALLDEIAAFAQAMDGALEANRAFASAAAAGAAAQTQGADGTWRTAEAREVESMRRWLQKYEHEVRFIGEHLDEARAEIARLGTEPTPEEAAEESAQHAMLGKFRAILKDSPRAREMEADQVSMTMRGVTTVLPSMSAGAEFTTAFMMGEAPGATLRLAKDDVFLYRNGEVQGVPESVMRDELAPANESGSRDQLLVVEWDLDEPMRSTDVFRVRAIAEGVVASMQVPAAEIMPKPERRSFFDVDPAPAATPAAATSASAPAAAPQGPTFVECVQEGGRLFVRVRLDVGGKSSERLLMVAETSPSTVVSRGALAEDADLSGFGTKTVQTAAGAAECRAGKVTVELGAAKGEVEAVVVPMAAGETLAETQMGLLGSDFFGATGCTVDRANKRIAVPAR